MILTCKICLLQLLVPEATIKYSEQGTVFVAVARPDDAFTSGSIGNTLKFEYKDVDDGEPIGDAQADEYQLEELEVSESDFVIGSHVSLLLAKYFTDLADEEKPLSLFFDIQYL